LASELRLTGTADRTGNLWSFNGSYSPLGTFYRDRTGLNRLSHVGQLRSNWRLSPRTRFTLSDAFAYTPEQGASATNVTGPVVLTQFTDRRGNRAGAQLGHQLGVSSALRTEVEHAFQSFSDPNLVDFTGVGLNVRWTRELSTRSGLDLSARAATNQFKQREFVEENRPIDPNAPTLVLRTLRRENQTYNLSAGGRLGMGTRLSARGLFGYDVVVPDDASLSPSSGTHAETAIQWTGRSVNAEAGYNQQLSTGSGSFAVSRTETWFTGTRVTFNRILGGSLYANQSTSRGAESQQDDETLARSGTGSLDVAFRAGFAGSLSYSRNAQWSDVEVSRLNMSGQQIQVVERQKIDDWRFGLSLTARFN